VAPPNGAIGVTWSNTPSARSFRVYYSIASGTPNFASIQTLNQSVGTSVTTTTIGGLSPGTSYLFQVRGVDANGVERGVPSSTTLGPTTGQNTIGSPILPSTGPIETPPAPPPLAAPSGVAVTATSSTTANLNWTGGGAAVSYQVAQALSPTGPFNVAAASTTSSTTVSGLTTNTTYYFQVRAVDGAGNLSTPSETVNTTTPADFVVTIGVSVMGTTSTTATLSWTPISTARSYQIGQASTAAGPFPSVMVSPTSMATVGNLTPNTTYYFQIRALDAAGNILGGPSSTASATTSS
jgi:chitodextrinase